MKKKSFLCVMFIAIMAFMAITACDGNKNTEKTPGPETGVYYCDALGKENLITLDHGDRVTYLVAGENKSGKYTYTKDSGKLEFSFYEKDAAKVEATLSGDEITLPYSGSTLTFQRIKDVDVTFDWNWNNNKETVSARVGRTVSAPEARTRAAYRFMGWYEDNTTFTVPFTFNTKKITETKTLYAFWVQESNQTEFLVNLDSNYPAGDNQVETLETINGKLYESEMPVLSYTGYTFKGWWISTNDAIDTAVREWSRNVVFTESATMFALWEKTVAGNKLPSPTVKVEGNSISWSGITGASSYKLEVTGPAGFTAIDETSPSTSKAVTFSVAGDYIIKVTAVSTASGVSSSDATVRTYAHKALARVSLVSFVEPSVLVFTKVADATDYTVTVDCGQSGHVHHGNIGDRDFYNFASCTMPAGGIKFTITASATGFASSVSREFVYNRVLDKITEFYLDEETEELWWNSVPGATSYMVSVSCGVDGHVHQANNGNKTSYSLKECAGEINVEVYPRATGYNSPSASSYTYTKSILPSPKNVRVEGRTIMWDEVDGATSYEIKFGDYEYTTLAADELSHEIPDSVSFASSTELTMRAIGATNSLWSNPVVVTEALTLNYTASTISWGSVIGAEGYEVRVNGGEITARTAAQLNLEIVLTKKGINVIEVRMHKGAEYSEWEALEVNAYEVSFNVRGGEEMAPIYKATGDVIDLADAERTGYNFSGWYTAETDGTLYEDEIFGYSIDVTLHAEWQARGITVEYDFQGKVQASAPAGKELTFDAAYELFVPENDTDDGKIFIGWYSEPSGRGTRYTNELGVSVAPWTVDSDGVVSVFAYWGDAFSFALVESGSGYSVVQTNVLRLVKNVIIPSSYNGKPVIAIGGYAFLDRYEILTVSIPNTIRNVGVSAFEGCVNLANVDMYEVAGVLAPQFSVMEGLLFQNKYTDDDLTGYELVFFPEGRSGEFILPEEMTYVPDRMFYGFAKLTRVEIHANITYIGTSAFEGCTGLEEVVFADAMKLTTIYDYAFRGCTALAAIEIPNSVEDLVVGVDKLCGIGVGAFANCSSLASLTFENGSPNKTLSIASGTGLGNDTGAFTYTNALRNVEIPTRVVGIGKYAFYGSGVTTVTFVVPGTSIAVHDLYIGAEEASDASASYVFGYSNLTTIQIPARATIIGNFSFANCSNLTNLTFATGTEELAIGTGTATTDACVFQNCTSLQSVEIPARANVLGARSFYGCTALSSVTFEETTGTEIELAISRYAFASCTSLASIEIPTRVTSIGSDAFTSCNSLTALTFEEGGDLPLVLAEGSLYGCANLTHITFPARLETFSYMYFGQYNRTIATVGVESGSEYFSASADGALLSADGKTLVFVPRANSGVYTIPSGVEVIGESAFYYCQNVTGITFVNTVTTISERAFFDCTGIQEITIPASVKDLGTVNGIGASAFRGCTNLETVIFNGTDAISIGDHAFYGCTALSTITLPASAVSIGRFAFYSCRNLTTVGLTSTSELVSIGDNAFSNCPLLTTLFIPKDVTTIGNNVLQNSNKIQNVIVDTDNTAFKSVEGVLYKINGDGDLTELVLYPAGRIGTTYEEFNIPSGITAIPADAFLGHTGLKKVVIPVSVTSIGARAFNGCRNLERVVFSSGSGGTITFGTGVFGGCTNLSTINIPERITGIAANFLDGTGITSLTIPSHITSIGNYAFRNTVRLTTLEFEVGSSLTIGTNAFEGTSALGDVVLPASLTNLGGSAFKNSGLTSVSIPGSITTFGTNIFEGCNRLATATFASTMAQSTKTLPTSMFLNSKALTSVTLPEDLKVINTSTFSGTGSITSITIPNTVTNINANAFQNSGVKEVLFAAGGTADLIIGVSANNCSAFIGCTQLTKVVLPIRLKDLHVSAFEGCTALTDVSFETGAVRLTAIGNTAFRGCTSLVSITIPNSITSIGTGVFANCSKLSTVNFPGEGEATTLTLGGTSFQNCVALTTMTLPSRISSINATAFNGCTALTAYDVAEGGDYSAIDGVLFKDGGATLVRYPTAKEGDSNGAYTVPKEVTLVANIAFANTANLISLKFEEGSDADLVIGNGTAQADSVFQASSFVYVEFPARTKSIGTHTFYNCKQLVNVSFVDGTGADVLQLTVLPNYMFYGCTALAGVESTGGGTEMIIPSTIVAMGTHVFYGCDALTNVRFDTTALTKIDNSAFYSCDNLTGIKIPASVTTIGSSTFFNCISLESVTFSQNSPVLNEIGANAFDGCVELDEIVLPSSLTVLGNGAFANCISLTKINIPVGVTSMLFVSSSSNTAVFASTAALKEFDVHADNPNFVDIDGVLFAKSGGNATTLLAFPAAYTVNSQVVTEYEIPSGVTAIGANAFDVSAGYSSATVVDNTLLTKITIPVSVTSIGNSAFKNTKAMTSIVFVEGGSSTLSLPTTTDNEAFSGSGITSVQIPARVTVLTRAFRNATALKTVTFEERASVIDIGDYAFNGCSSLTSVALPAVGIGNIIGTSAFHGCTNLVTIDIPQIQEGEEKPTMRVGVYIPDNVITMKTSAFNGCASIEYLELPASWAPTTGETSVFANTTSLGDVVIPSGVVTFGNNLFQNSGITSIELPTGLKTIGNSVFIDCTRLTAITLPEGLTSLGNSAFQRAGITSIVVPSSVTNLTSSTGTRMFEGSSLVRAEILATTAHLPTYMFTGCADLEEVILSEGLTTINTNVFQNCGSLNIITLPSTLKVISNFAFQNTSSLTNLVIPEGVTTIGATNGNVFEGSGLISIDLPSTVTFVTANAFKNCVDLVDVVSLGSITELKNSIFDGCVSLENVNIPGNITLIGDFAFRDCVGLTSIVIPNSVTTIGNNPFVGCSATVSYFGEGANFVVEDGIIFNASMTQLMLYPSGRVGEYVVPEGVVGINDYAFANTTGITSLTLPASVTTIATYAFQNSSITSIIMPGVTSVGVNSFENSGLVSISMPNVTGAIGNNVFLNCANLETVVVTSKVTSLGNNTFNGCESLVSITGLTSVVSIGTAAFQGCISLESINLSGLTGSISNNAFQGCESLESIVLPAAVSSATSIGTSAFAGCISLTGIAIPNGMEVIAGSAFAGCESLETVSIPNTVTEIGASAFEGCTSIETIVIPSTITNIGASVFAGWTSDQTICVMVRTEAPATWNGSWDEDCDAEIVWNYTEPVVEP